MRLILGNVSAFKPLRNLTSLKLLREPEALRALWMTLLNEKHLTDARIDDYPRAELDSESIARLDQWVKTWAREHEHLQYHETGRECQALARALALDLMLYTEVDGNAAQIIAGVVSGRGHEVAVVRGAGHWVAYEPRQGRLAKMWPAFKGVMF